MEVGIKERVIGAVVLVVLGIIIIPWVLQGPAPDSSVTRNVSLPAASTSTAPAEYRMNLNNPPAQNTGPQASAGASHAPEQVPQQQVMAVPAVRAPAAVKPQTIQRVTASAKPHAESGGWMIQAGSYSSETNARRLQKTLEGHGYKVVLSPHVSGGKTYYRVRVGPYAARGTADKALPAINRIYGGKARVVPNN